MYFTSSDMSPAFSDFTLASSNLTPASSNLYKRYQPPAPRGCQNLASYQFPSAVGSGKSVVSGTKLFVAIYLDETRRAASTYARRITRVP